MACGHEKWSRGILCWAGIQRSHGTDSIMTRDVFGSIHVTLEEDHVRVLLAHGFICWSYGMAWSTPIVYLNGFG
jgi:hypothetical protein